MRRLHSGRSIFLFELALLFSLFMIAVLISTGLFLSSREKSAQAEALSNASAQSVSIADTIKACGSDIRQAKTLLGADENFDLYYSEDWQRNGKAVYRAHVDYTIENHLLTANIRFFEIEKQKTIFQLEVKEFLEAKK